MRDQKRLCALALGLLLVAPTALSAQEDADSKTRAALLASIAADKKKDVETALKGREGDFADLVLSAVAEDPAALSEAKKLLPVLPADERKGLTAIADRLLAATPADRKAFVSAYGATRGVERRAVEGRWTAEERNAEVAEARKRAEAAADPYLIARIDLAEAAAQLDAPYGPRAAAFEALRKAFEAAGDRRREALATAHWAVALLANFEGEAAITARNAAQTLLVDSGAPHDKGPAADLLGEIDLVLAEAYLNEGRADAALGAAARAKQTLRKPSADQAIRLALATADARMEASGPAAAVDSVKPLVAAAPGIEDKRRLVEIALVVSRILRRAGKFEENSRFLALCRLRGKSLGLEPADEAVVLYLSAVGLAAEGKDDAARTGFSAAEEAAKKGGATYVTRTARAGLALMQLARNKDEAAAKRTLTEALAISAGGPTLDRLTAAAFRLAFGETLLNTISASEAMPWLAEAAAVCDDLGCTFETLPGRADTVRVEAEVPLRERIYKSLRELKIGITFAAFEPIYAAMERARCEDFVRYLPDDGAVDEKFEREVRESEIRVARLRRALQVGRKQPDEAEAAKVVELRRSLKSRAAGRSGAFALRHFPQPATLKRVREQICGGRGAVYGLVADDRGGWCFAFSTENFHFYGIPPRVETKKILAAFAKVAADPKSTPDAFIAAAGPIYEELVKPVASVFNQKSRLLVYADPVTDPIPFEALVPPDAKGNFGTLPYLGNQIAVGRLVTASMTREARLDGGGRRWLKDPRLIGCVDRDQADLTPFAAPFGTAVQFLTAAQRKGGAPSPSGGPGSVLVAGPKFPQKYLDWHSSKAPDLLVLSDPPEPPREGMDPFRSIAARGARAVLAPTSKMEPELLSALAVRAVSLVASSGAGPLEALAEAQRTLVNGGLQGAQPLKGDYRHPAFWTKLRVYAVAP